MVSASRSPADSLALGMGMPTSWVGATRGGITMPCSAGVGVAWYTAEAAVHGRPKRSA